MSLKRHDFVVLGGGNAIALGIRAANAGHDVAVIEKDRLGGTCPNRGCIPSKLLLGYAEVATTIREAARFHMTASLDAVDQDAILVDTKAATFDVVDDKIAGNLPENITLYRGHGRFVGPRTLQVGDDTLEADKVILGTGTRPRHVDVPGLDGTPFWTSDDVFELDKAPRSITVVGGGYIACELAYFFSSIGVDTTVLVRSDVLMREEDDEVRPIFQERFSELLDVRTSTTIASVEHANGDFKMQLAGPEGTSEHTSERLLFAAGRVPNSDDIGLDLAGVDVDADGWVVHDDHLRTTAEGVYCLGDLKGKHLFTHAAAWEATYLGDILLDGKDGALEYGPMPHAVFTHPEIAGVGATQQELEAAGTDFTSTSLPYTSAAKGRAIKETHGLCKFLLSPDGEILGCHIVGHHASTLLHEVIPVMRWRNHISSLTGIIHIHPSLSEVVRNCARRAEASLSS